MREQIHTIKEPAYPMSMNPKRFALWLFMISVVMIFAALTSAYIVRAGEGNWLEFQMPSGFMANTIIILLSSGTMQWAYFAAKRDEITLVKIAMLLTILLGIAFLVGQWMAWGQLVQNDVYFVGNPSGSFVYVFTGVHAVHIISAIVFAVVTLIYTFIHKVHSKKMLKIELCATYWHFLDAIWIYLFVFILMHK
jgi:cytochrome c oxidase subunit III